MKKLYITCLLLLPIVCYGQSLLISDVDNNLYSIDIVTCEYEFLSQVNAQVYDIAFHPDGTLYGISGNGRFYSIDIATGQVTDIFDFAGQTFNSLTITGTGEVFTVGSNGLLYAYDAVTSSVRFIGDIGFQPTGDLTFFDGELYVAVTQDRIVRINTTITSLSEVVIDENIEGSIFGIVSFAEDDCRRVTPIAITDGNSSLYTIDFDSLKLTFLCQIDITVTGGASTFEFFASNPASIDSVEVIPTTCNEANGQLTVFGNSDAAGLEYSINGLDFQLDSVFSLLPAGELEVTMKDINGCKDSTVASIPVSNGVIITSVLIQDATCGQDNGQLEINTNDTTGTSTYSINGGDSFVDVATFSGLTVGTYDLVVLDENGCTDGQQAMVAEIAAIQVEDVQITPTTCGLPNGSLNVTSSEGSAVMYGLSDGTEQETSLFTELTDSIYTVYVTDSDGCSDSLIVTLTAILPVAIDSVEVVDATCGLPNGRVDISVTVDSCLFSIDDENFQSKGIFAALERGTYMVTVIDSNGCEAATVATVEGPEPISITDVEAVPADCGLSNGAVSIALLTDVGPLLIFGNNSDTLAGTYLEGLDIGEQQITVQDTNGCTATALVLIEEGNCPFSIPNIFSPNGDGINDELAIVFHPNFKGSVQSFDIYDRYGGRILSYGEQSTGSDAISWDGRQGSQLVSSGVYTYLLVFTRRDGTIEQHVGTITVLL